MEEGGFIGRGPWGSAWRYHDEWVSPNDAPVVTPGRLVPHESTMPRQNTPSCTTPQMPSTWWSSKRIRTYLLFDATGIVYFLIAFLGIRLIDTAQS